MSHHQGGTLYTRDDVSDRVGLARARDPEQSLMRQAIGQPFCQALDGLRLIARRLIVGNQFKESRFHGASANIAQVFRTLRN